MTTTESERLQLLYEKIIHNPVYRSDRMGNVFVPGRGASSPDVVFVGEAPGRDEERLKEPFVGAAGKNLNQLLEHVRLDRDQVFITNLTKYRPCTPDGRNRKPNAGESRRALPFLWRELEILSPEIVVCLGASPASALLEEPKLVMKEANGEIWKRRGRIFLVTYHPSPFNFHVPAKRQALFEAFGRLPVLLKEANR